MSMRENRVVISLADDSLERRLERFFLKYDICIKVINDRIKKGIVDI